MLEGWYCRTLANQGTSKTSRQNQSQSDEEPPTVTATEATTSQTPSSGVIDYKERYKNLKRKLKFLVYENEYFQDMLLTNQRRLQKVSKDRSFLLDRLMVYEKPAKDSSDSDVTDSTDDMEPSVGNLSTSASVSGRMQSQSQLSVPKENVRKQRKIDGSMKTSGSGTRGRRRKIDTHSSSLLPTKQMVTGTIVPSLHKRHNDISGSLSVTEKTDQLQQAHNELTSSGCTSTESGTILGDENPSICYPGDTFQQLMEDDSPSHVAAEECVAMEYTS